MKFLIIIMISILQLYSSDLIISQTDLEKEVNEYSQIYSDSFNEIKKEYLNLQKKEKFFIDTLKDKNFSLQKNDNTLPALLNNIINDTKYIHVKIEDYINNYQSFPKDLCMLENNCYCDSEGQDIYFHNNDISKFLIKSDGLCSLDYIYLNIDQNNNIILNNQFNAKSALIRKYNKEIITTFISQLKKNNKCYIGTLTMIGNSSEDLQNIFKLSNMFLLTNFNKSNIEGINNGFLIQDNIIFNQNYNFLPIQQIDCSI